ncbi:hypothetical protein EJB05_53167, partial [Eragrostis curvula]
MRTEVITADTVDEAVERILKELKEDAAGNARTSNGGRHNVIYFDGWDGLGASAVLRAVGQRLTTPAASQEKEQRAPAAAAGLEFSHIFHIDCSIWESKRAMQRMIAEQLKLPASVMEMFDAQDEEDDYQGIGKGSRTEIPLVAEVINQHIQKLNRFLLIFNNGSSEEIDLDSLGFPLFDRYSRSKVLSTFQGRFRLYPRTKVDGVLNNTRVTDVILSAEKFRGFSDLVEVEAAEVARDITVGSSSIDWHAATANCFLYMMKLCQLGNDLATDFDLVTHACNYWRCDGVIQLQDENVGTEHGVDKLWGSANALQREIRLDADRYQSPLKRRLLKRMALWTSPTYGFKLIPDPHRRIPKGMFQQFDKLCVLKISYGKFNFMSPPFICCHNLRFLWLDHCQDESSIAEVVNEEDIQRFVQSLWVLDVCYSNKAFLSKDMMDFMTQLREVNVLGEKELWHVNLVQSRLHNIHRLRIKESTVNSPFHFSGMDKMELLELSRNYTLSMWSRIFVKSCRSLETVIINEFNDLIDISVIGCAKLKNILLSGSLMRLRKMHIIGAGVETLDFSKVTTPELDELCLLDCDKLCAILCLPAVDKLSIDTTQKEGTTAGEGEREHTTGKPPGEFDWHISLRDTRIFQSLEPLKDNFGPNHTHLDISSPSHHLYTDDSGSKDDRMKSCSRQHVQENLKQLIKDTAICADVTATFKDINKQQKQDNEGDTDAPVIMCICPPPPSVPSQGCYIHIEDKTRAKLQATSASIPAFVCDSAKILHVHDSLSVTSIVAAPLASTTWNQLEWCRIERCPKLECVFRPHLGAGEEGSNIHTEMFKKLRTTWASGLPVARYIWKWSGKSTPNWSYGRTFEDLTLLHIDCCTRLVHVIYYPFIERNALDRLETLEIMWCDDLSMVFHCYDTPGQPMTLKWWRFLKLKHIRLHELPQLQKICNADEILMPELETIKISGCWSLRTLPIVDTENVVECDCEKEWWHRLEWERAEQASKYKPTHPRHYKKTMLKGSVLSCNLKALFFICLSVHSLNSVRYCDPPGPLAQIAADVGRSLLLPPLLPVISSRFRFCLLGFLVRRSALSWCGRPHLRPVALCFPYSSASSPSVWSSPPSPPVQDTELVFSILPCEKLKNKYRAERSAAKLLQLKQRPRFKRHARLLIASPSSVSCSGVVRMLLCEIV